jgi:uncharacterized protein (TIGR02646 family)
MVKLNKQALPCSINSSKDWSHGTPIREALEEDCHGKCYICEVKPKNTAELTVDHIVSRQHNAALEFEWDNLLLACIHCNRDVKRGKYNGIINPTVIDPEKVLSFGYTYDMRDIVITALSSDAAVLETKQLLDEVYKDRMFVKKMTDILKLLINYIKHADLRDDWAIDYIRDEISRSSEFAAFKRKIVRDDERLRELYAEELA